MIKLRKSPKPQILERKSQDWTRDLLAKIAAGEKLSVAVGGKYSHVEIKESLLRETHEKCAYCESKVTHIAYGDIEHITAKVVDPALAYEWDNLTLACDKCNQNKADLDGIIDPYVLDPSDHFLFFGPLVKGRPDSEIGMLTEKVLKLNRPQLIEKRSERIEYVVQMRALAGRVHDQNLRAEIIGDMLACANQDQEYSAAIGECLKLLQ